MVKEQKWGLWLLFLMWVKYHTNVLETATGIIYYL